ncbi:hypothetical protein diail_1491 [Diaporthe ilicicola]|nr:hypothetical protein diail_1491 [Diaporthe ilicicola]
MALELTGLTIGAVALVGTFKDCIDVFGMIAAARSLTDDAKIIRTKFDVEKMLLLQWADRIGLVEPESYDRRLDDPDLKRTIASVLECIKRLLSDGTALKDRYGLVDYHEARHDPIFDACDKLETAASSKRLQRFIESFHKLTLSTDVPRREHSVSTRFKWVVRDKEKFASLMEELSYFISRLNALIPAQEQSAWAMTEEDLAQIRSIPQLKRIFQVSTGFQPQIALVAEQRIQFLNQGRVLDRLWFRWVDDRKTSINERHFRTLDWALDPLQRTTKWDNLAEWLRDGSGLYWLAGKAGSGKSTLMKCLSDHPQTTNLLLEWLGQSELVTLQFFFYALGRSEQKSQEGLLRSLLFQFLNKHRSLIENVLPAMWKEAVITEEKVPEHDLTMPSIPEMQASLLQLTGTVSADKKFWILIDGLDEFEGKHATLAVFCSRLEKLPNVKVLVSSRPLSVFVSAFGCVPKMYLQDLTKRDIETYINDTILHNPYVVQLSRIEQEIGTKIAELLTDKASGVFLWVILACQSILEGLEEYETGPELMSRAMELPTEMHDFFRQIIIGLDPRKRDQSVRILRLIFESQTSSDFDPVPTMGFAIVDEQGLRADYMGPSVTRLSNDQKVLRCQIMEGRLRSRCSGLVEIEPDSAISLATETLDAESAAIVHSRVVFMHRSLYEFLCTEGMWEWDVLRVDNKYGEFEPHAILASLWAQLAGLQPRDGSWAGPWDAFTFRDRCFNNSLVHSLRAAATNCPPSVLATSLSRIQNLFAGEGLYITFGDMVKVWLAHQWNCQESYVDLSFALAVAAELGMVALVQLALEDPDGLRSTLVAPEAGRVVECSSLPTCPSRLHKLNRAKVGSNCRSRSLIFPLLYHATCRPFLRLLQKTERLVSRINLDIFVSTEIVDYLLEEGHDPNEEFFEFENKAVTTPWIRWLEFIGPGGQGFLDNEHSDLTDSEGGVELAHQHAAFTMLLIDAGAEIGAPETSMYDLVDKSLSEYISNAAKRTARKSVKWARSDDMWLNSLYKSQDVVQVNLPAESGEMGVLANHVPSIEQLKPGLVEIVEESGSNKQFFLSGGFAVVQPNSSLSINAVEAYPIEDFSADAVRNQLAEAQKIVNGGGSEQDIAEAKIELEASFVPVVLETLQASLKQGHYGADEAHKAFEDSGGVHLTIRDGDALTSYNRSVPPSPTKETADPLVTLDAEDSLRNNTVQKQDVGESSRHQPLNTTAPSKSRGSKTSPVKNSPFIVADRLSAGGPSASRPLNTSQGIRRGAAPSECISRRSDSEHIDDHFMSAAASFGRSTELMRPLRMFHTRRNIIILIVSVVGTLQVTQSIKSMKTMVSGMKSGTVVMQESLSMIVATKCMIAPLLIVLGPESTTHTGPRRMSDITSTRTVIHLITALRTVSLTVVASTGKKFGFRNYPESIDSERLDEFRAKHSPERAGTWRSREQVKSHRSHRPSGSPHRHKADKEIEEEDFQDVRRRLHHNKAPPSTHARFDQLPKDTSTRIAHRDAEKSLRKIRSEAKILLSKISEPEDESMETEVRHSGTAKDHEPAGLSVPSSATSLTGETSPERPQLSAKEKGKGKASVNTFGQTEPPRPGKPVTGMSHDHRRHDQISKSDRIKPASWDKDKAREVAKKQSEMPHSIRTSAQQHSAKSRQPAAERGGEHQCDWKDKYDTLKAEAEMGRPGLDLGVDEVGHDHQCDWKEKYLALKPEVEGDQAQQQADLGLEGLTIVLHMRGKDDLVINTDLRELGQ